VKPPKDLSDMDFVAGTAGQEVRMRTGPGEKVEIIREKNYLVSQQE